MARASFFLLAITILISTGCAATSVTPFSVGDSVDFADLENQHGEPFKNNTAMTLLLYVNGMDAKEIVRESLEKINLQCMDDGQLVYVADISGMPSIISKLVAVPRMRDYPYPIWLDYDGASSEQLPAKDNMVSVISVEQQKITNIQFAADEAALTNQLVPLCGAKAAENN